MNLCEKLAQIVRVVGGQLASLRQDMEQCCPGVDVLQLSLPDQVSTQKLDLVHLLDGQLVRNLQ